jgi:hypothetical protein
MLLWKKGLLMSNLVKHAETELMLIGEDQETIKGLLKVVRAFASMGHSGGSASVGVAQVARLLAFENLSPLTDNPREWMLHEPEVWSLPLWQNIRNSAAFSNNGGRTYWLVSDSPRRWPRRRFKMHKSAKWKRPFKSYVDDCLAAYEVSSSPFRSIPDRVIE